MRPLQLTMSAWGPYAEVVEVDFTKFERNGLFLITGPTGGGKTTIFDAISFALYGNVSGKIRDKNTVRSDFAKADTDTFVELNFQHKGKLYRVKRSPKFERPKKRGEGFTTSNETAELYVEQNAPLVSVVEVNKKLEEIMGINYEQYKQIAMIAQGEFLELLLANSKERVEIFRNLFQTELYEKLQKNLTEQSIQLYKQIKSLQDKMDEAVSSLDTAEQEELQQLTQTQYYQYDKICICLKDWIKAEKKELSILEKEIGNKEEHVKLVVSQIKEGELLNQQFQQYQECKKELERLSSQREQIQLVEEELKKAALAGKAAGEEKVYRNLKERLDVLKEKLPRMEAELEVQLPKFQESEQDVKKNVARLAKIELMKERANEMERMVVLFQELSRQQKNLDEKEKGLQELLKLHQNMTEEIKTIQIRLDQMTDELEKSQNLDYQIGENNLNLEKAKGIQQELEQAYQKQLTIEKEQSILLKLQKKYLEAESYLREKTEAYDQKEKIYRQAAVGIVARFLEENKPCPVCGSIDHPEVAALSEDVPDEKELELLKEEKEQAGNQFQEIYQQSLLQKANVDNLIREMEEAKVRLSIFSDANENIADILKEHLQEGKQDMEKLQAIKKELEQQSKRKLELRNQMNQQSEQLNVLGDKKEKLQQQYQQIKSETDQLTGTIQSLKSNLPEDIADKNQADGELEHARKEIELLQKEVDSAAALYNQLKEKIEQGRTLLKQGKTDLEQLIEEEEKERIAFINFIQSLGFENVEQYHKALLKDEVYEKKQSEVKKYFGDLQSKQEQVQAFEHVLKDKQEVDLTSLQEKLNREDEEKRDVLKTKERMAGRVRINQNGFTSIQEKLREKEALDEKYGVLKDLDNVTKGNNNDRVIFEHYVLAAYFEEILRAANYRLTNMTGGRYELKKVSMVADARKKDSLDLEVLDNYTGKRRSVKTLSGGESFKAALSMALGLSDIIQNHAGGIHIDTLFIDEGFGALDEESLDQALNTLMKLTEYNRMIGIISHVSELKERIDNQIVIEKSSNGSSIRS